MQASEVKAYIDHTLVISYFEIVQQRLFGELLHQDEVRDSFSFSDHRLHGGPERDK
jgi:hypothetical protein